MANEITLTAPSQRRYISKIFVNGIDSGFYGVATTPNEAARQARLKLRQLGRPSIRNRLIAMCVIAK
jgi:hypothetical protein